MQQLSSIKKKFIIIIYCFIYNFTLTVKEKNILIDKKIHDTNQNFKKDNVDYNNQLFIFYFFGFTLIIILLILYIHSNNSKDEANKLKELQELKSTTFLITEEDEANKLKEQQQLIKEQQQLLIKEQQKQQEKIDLLANKPISVLTTQKDETKLQNIILEGALQKASQKNKDFNTIMTIVKDIDQLITIDEQSIENQIKNLSTLRLEELKLKEIEAFDENIQYIDSDALNGTKLFIPYLPADHIQYFTENQIKKFNGNILDQFNKEQVQAFDKNIKDIDPNALSSAYQFLSYLDLNQIINALKKEQIEKFHWNSLFQFNEAQIKAFGDKIKHIDVSQLKYNNNKFIPHIPSNNIQFFEIGQIRTFNSNILLQFNQEQVQAFGDNIKYIDIDELSNTCQFVINLSLYQIKNALTEEQIKKFNPHTLDEFNEEKVLALDEKIGYIDPDLLLNTKKFITYLSSKQIEQYKHIYKNQTKDFDEKKKQALLQIAKGSNQYNFNNINKLKKGTIETLNEKILYEFNENQVKALNDNIQYINIKKLKNIRNFVLYDLYPNDNEESDENDSYYQKEVIPYINSHYNFDEMKFITYIASNQIKNFKSDQIKEFNNDILNQFNKEQVQAFGNNIQYINSNALNGTRNFISYIPANQINNFTENQIKKFNINILNQFNQQQVQAFGDKIKNIDPSDLSNAFQFIMNLSPKQKQIINGSPDILISNTIISKLEEKEENLLRDKYLQNKTLIMDKIKKIRNQEENFQYLNYKNISLTYTLNYKIFSYYSFNEIQSFLPKEIENFNSNILDQFNQEQVQAFGDKIQYIDPDTLIKSFQFVSYFSKKQINENLKDIQIQRIRKQIISVDTDQYFTFQKEQKELIEERFNKIIQIQDNSSSDQEEEEEE